MLLIILTHIKIIYTNISYIQIKCYINTYQTLCFDYDEMKNDSRYFNIKRNRVLVSID